MYVYKYYFYIVWYNYKCIQGDGKSSIKNKKLDRRFLSNVFTDILKMIDDKFDLDLKPLMNWFIHFFLNFWFYFQNAFKFVHNKLENVLIKKIIIFLRIFKPSNEEKKDKFIWRLIQLYFHNLTTPIGILDKKLSKILCFISDGYRKKYLFLIPLTDDHLELASRTTS